MFNILHLHPMLVHFPIALFFTSFFFDILFRFTRKKEFQKMGYYILILAVITGALAAGAGILIEDKIESSGISERQIDDHKGFAMVALVIFVVLLVFRFFKKGDLSGQVFNLYILLSFVAILLLSYAAFKGGKLVYEYGAAVQQLPVPSQTK
ncbi:MAG: DUF2231 domain-containing protein [Nitrospirae bacterium]|nr:DUF2231 domain-containing protein [Nitrospirota bacterium]